VAHHGRPHAGGAVTNLPSRVRVMWRTVALSFAVGILTLVAWILLVGVGILFVLQGIGQSRQLFFVGLLVLTLIVSIDVLSARSLVRYVRELRQTGEPEGPMFATGGQPQRHHVAIASAVTTLFLFFASYAIWVWLGNSRAKRAERTAPIVQIESIDSHREGNDEVIEIAMAQGRGGAYRLNVELLTFPTLAPIDRKEQVLALGAPLTQRFVYRASELESLWVQKTPMATSHSDSAMSFEIVAGLVRLESGGSRSSTESTSTRRERIMIDSAHYDFAPYGVRSKP